MKNINLLKLPIFMLAWLGVLAVKIPTALSGFLIVPFLYKYRDVNYENLPSWTRPWANPEDWEGRGNGSSSLPIWWIKLHGESLKSFYHYHAIRNPANGLRSYEWLDADIDPSLVEWSTNYYMPRYEPSTLRKVEKKTIWYIAWVGYRAGIKIIHIWNDERHLVIKFGWRIEPSDRHETDTDTLGLKDASFASKILFYRKG
jgi:hypothetical protein